MEIVDNDNVKSAQDFTIGELARRVEAAEKELNTALEKSVKSGRKFTDLAMVLGCTEGAIRLKAKRLGWYEPGSRRRLPN